ncbi:Cysteine proteinases superfamily protein [Raphanus sativus]|nr:Cysteine proteinases superfamily protein [Raphanus sativus]
MIEQKEVLARLIEVAHNITAVNPLSFIQISIQDLVSKIKTKEEDKEITSLKRVFKVISHPGIKKVPTTRHVNPEKTKTVSWNFDSEEAADMNFISARLETSPVGIIIDVDNEFYALTNGFYRIRNIPGAERRHALIVMARGLTEDGQHFLIVQNSWKKSWGVNGYGRLILADDMTCLAFYPLM